MLAYSFVAIHLQLSLPFGGVCSSKQEASVLLLRVNLCCQFGIAVGSLKLLVLPLILLQSMQNILVLLLPAS